MTLTILAITGMLVGVAAVYAVVTKPAEALAGETTISDAVAAADTLATGHPVAPLARTEWHLTTVSALCDAEDLLDALEVQGFEERELVILGNSCFAVRWR